MAWRALLAACALVLAPGAAAVAGQAASAVVAGAGTEAVGAGSNSPRRVMVMLTLGAGHFRSGSDYGGDYGDSMGARMRERMARRIARDHRLTYLESWPMDLAGIDCVVLEIPDARPVEAVVTELSGAKGVAWSQPLNEFRMQGAADVSRPGVYNDRLFPAQPAAFSWHLANLHRMATGRGVTVAIVDSRVDTTHPDLIGQIAATADFVAGRPQFERHGTGVAGIIGARPNNAMGIAGIAPGARILALRACWEKTLGGSTVCDSLSLAKALVYSLEHRANVINLSLTGPHDRLMATLVDLAMARGTTVVAAIDEARPSASFPAFLPGVISVGDEHLSDRTGSAYIAPGLDVPTTQPEGKWNIVSGSSYAAAHVSGLAALLRQLSGNRQSTETLLGPHGTIDACAAVARISPSGRGACPPVR